ncbi:MAG: type II toxin-antitoxin system RelB/DinJ family antitoxin [Verrucomicrobia bacterium]|nr:type II toxin-antitoxin system RelB/DinJ family antitoxin [Verrucomicrobiota bacterium]
MSKTATVRAEIETNLKAEVEAILAGMGLTAAETIQLLYRQIRRQHGLPFPAEIPNKLTAKTLRESKAGRNVKYFAEKQDLDTDLGM